MKICVTGGSGFIGSNLCEGLLKDEHDYLSDDHTVVCFDDLSNSTMANVRHLFNYQKRFKFVKGDVRDKVALESACEDCDYIAHLAAQIHVDRSSYEPHDTITRNVDGTMNVLELSRRKDIPVVFASSSEIYGTAQYGIMDENHPTNPQSIYAASKLAGDRLCNAYFETYGIPVTVLRQFNAYGPRQADTSYGGVISIFTKRVLAGQNPLVYGSGEATRDYCVTGDTLILTSDYSWKHMKDIRVGDSIVSFDEVPLNKKRSFRISKVKAITNYVSDNLFEIKTNKGNVRATGNHPWLVHDDHGRNKYITTEQLRKNLLRHPQVLRSFSRPVNPADTIESREYVSGYVAGSIEGDGYINTYTYKGKAPIYRVALEVIDKDFRDTCYSYLKQLGMMPNVGEREWSIPNRKKSYRVVCSKKADYDTMLKLLSTKDFKDKDFCRGYIAGMFDAEGEYDKSTTSGQLRISNKDPEVITNITTILKKFNFNYSLYAPRSNGVRYIHLLGGIQEHIRFFSLFKPKITRKHPSICNKILSYVDSKAKIVSIEKIASDRVYNMEVEGTHTYIANGFLCHNTYVDDVVEAYMKIIGGNFFGKFINYGTGQDTRIIDLAKKIITLCGMDGKVVPVHVAPRPNEVMKLCCDNRSAKILFNNSPKYMIDEGLEKYIRWYRGEGT